MKFHKQALMASLVGVGAGWILYRHILGMVFMAILCGLGETLFSRDIQQGLKHEFRMFLTAIHTELMVGNTMRLAVENSRETVPFSNGRLVSAIDCWCAEVRLGQAEWLAWQHFNDSLSMPLINDFTDGLMVAYQGGNEVAIVVKESINVMADQINLELDMDVIIAAKRFEFHLMILLPLGILAMLNFMDYPYVSVLYESITGRLVMTGVMVLLTIAYWIGTLIIRIEV